jgi:DnaK suppressor protein
VSKSSVNNPPNAKAATGTKAAAKKVAPVTTAKKPSTPTKPSAAQPAAPTETKVPGPKASAKAPAQASQAKPAPAPEPSAKAATPKPAPKPATKAPSASPATSRSSALSVDASNRILPAPSNRFSERFSPPKPPSRGYPEPMETVKLAIKADPKLVNAWKTKAGRDLTEPELLAMPEAEYMNEKQLEFFRARLQALKDDLLSNAGETTEHLREDTSIVPDPADRATIEEEHALELRTRDRERKLLKKISQSLGRIEAGDYGFCDETGEPIGLGRLLARPTATLSLEAQQRREMKQKMFGD